MARDLAVPRVTAIPLGRPSPDASSNQPERQAPRDGRGRLAASKSLLFGFAPGGACHAADVAARAVRSYRTLSPLPSRLTAFRPRGPAVCFLWRFPWGRPRRTLSGAVSVWSPDFPPPSKRRPSGRLAGEGIWDRRGGGQAESDAGGRTGGPPRGPGKEPAPGLVHCRFTRIMGLCRAGRWTGRRAASGLGALVGEEPQF